MSPRFTIRPLSAQPDARLVELARAGEERAFETLVRRHRRALARYARRIGLPEHLVDDVLQQALTKAWLALDRGVEVREPRAWLYRIVHNAAINSIRGAGLHVHESIETVPPARAPHAPGEIDTGLRAREALGHVAALPALQRDAIALTAIGGHSHEEAATLLGVSDGAVRGLLYRARTTLRSAAAALSPLGLFARASGEGGLAERTAELSAGGAAAGAAGIVTKGFLATAVAGLLAAGGTIAHFQSGGSSRPAHHAPASAVKPGAASSPGASLADAPGTFTSLPLSAGRSGGGEASGHPSRHGGGRGSSGRDESRRHSSARAPSRDDHGGGSGSSTGPASDRHGGDQNGAAPLTTAAPEHSGSGSDHSSGSGDSAPVTVLETSGTSGSGGPGPSSSDGGVAQPVESTSSSGDRTASSSSDRHGSGSGSGGGEAEPAATGADS
jgi:RNA polymerase sigma factor (sigma-70 family)